MPDLFSFKTLRSHYSLVPLVVICGGGAAMGFGYLGYMCAYKTDISFRPRSWAVEAPYQSVKPEEIRKFIKHHRPNTFDPEIEALKRELGRKS